MPKKLLVVLGLLSLVFVQCTTKKNNSPLKESNLASQFYEIDINHDTVLHTQKGAIITIEKGSLTSSTSVAKLEIKEAYSMADILQAGLVTTAGKEILSSGGMIYIDAAKGSDAKIAKPLAVAIPTNNVQEGMKLFKGERNNDSTINWANPQPLQPREVTPDITAGEVLFRNNCASCHNPVKDATGPALAFLDRRRDEKWLLAFVRNSAELIANRDPLANCIYEKYNKTAMSAFPQITAKELHQIFEYVNDKAADTDPNSIPDIKKKIDSCKNYEKQMALLINKRANLVTENDKLTAVNNNSAAPSAPNMQASPAPQPATIPDNTVRTTGANSEYYKVKIETFGWYNIDILTKNLPGFENSELIVRLIGTYKSEITMYCILPEKKIMLNGGLVNGKSDQYCFYTDDGKIPLPQNTRAIIIATFEENGQLYFGSTSFTTALTQSPELTITATTSEAMKVSIEKMNVADFNIEIGKSKNAESIKEIDEQLKVVDQLRPQNFNCGCADLVVESDTGRLHKKR